MPVLRFKDNCKDEAEIQENSNNMVMIMEDELKELIGNLQIQNQQLQALQIQKQTLSTQQKEIDNALEEIGKNPEEIYKTVGPILVKTAKTEIIKDLNETKEDIQLKIKTIESQEKKLSAKMEENQKKFKEMMPIGKGG